MQSRKRIAYELEPGFPYPAHVIIEDGCETYRINVSDGVLAGKVESLTVSDTRGLRRRIVLWLADSYSKHGLRLGTIYFTVASPHHPACRASGCHHGTCDGAAQADRKTGRGSPNSRAKSTHCETCGGAGYILPGFSE